MIKPGDTSPNFELQATDGETVSLSDALHDGRRVLLVFLRHLG